MRTSLSLPRYIALASLLALSFATQPLLSQEQSSEATDRAKALQLYNAHKSLEALPLLEKLLPANPTDGELQEAYGAALLDKAAIAKDDSESAETLKRARKAFKAAYDAGTKSNFVLIMLEQIPADGKRARFSSHDEAEAAMKEGEAFYAKQEFDKAIQSYSRAHILDPTLYSAPLFIGDCYFASKQYGSAGEWFAKAVAIDPNRETAYRYWGDALAYSGKMAEAREKFIHAYISEPNSNAARVGIVKWANYYKVTPSHPDIKSPNQIGPGKKDGDVNIVIDPSSLGKKDGSEIWMTYELSRAAWRASTFKEKFPNEKEYHFTLEEEVDSLSMVVTVLKEGKRQKKLAKDLDQLVKLHDSGLLEPFVLMTRTDPNIQARYAEYLKANRAKLYEYVDKFVLPQAPVATK